MEIVKKKPSLGDWRLVRRFILFPKRLDGEWRWFGRHDIAQKYIMRFVPFAFWPGGFYERGWVDKGWL